MKIANPLMTVLLLSCFFTYAPGLIERNKNLDLNDDDKNQPNDDDSELFRQSSNIKNISPLKEESLKKIISERKKKKKTTCSIIIPGNTFNTEQNSCTDMTEEPAYDEISGSCVPSKSTKKPKETKKSGCKTLVTTAFNTKTPKSKALSNDTGAADGSNKWKKIQNFFFGPPSWPFTKLGKQGGSQKNESDKTTAVANGCVQPWPKNQKCLDAVDETTITMCTYLHPIPNDKSDDSKEERELIKEEIIRKKAPDKENIPNEDDIQSRELLTESCGSYTMISNRPITEGENIPPNVRTIKTNVLTHSKQINDMEETPSKQWNDIPKMPNKQSYEVQERLPSKGQMGPNERILSKEWTIKQEKIPSCQKKMASKEEERSESCSLPKKEFINGVEKLTTKEALIQCEEENIPAKKKLLTKDNRDYKNTKESSKMETLETENTMAIDEPLSEAIEIRYIKQEDVTDSNDKKIEIPIFNKNSQLPLRPEGLIETGLTHNKTSISKLHPSFKQQQQNNGVKLNEWFPKNKEHQLAEKHFKRFESNFFNNEKDHITHEMTKASVENIIPKIYKSSSDCIQPLKEFEKKMTYDSTFFLKAFHQFLKDNFPEILNLQNNQKEHRNITQEFYPFIDRPNSNLFKIKQPSSVNAKNNTQLSKNKSMYDSSWQYTKPYLKTSTNVIGFNQATYPFTLVKENNKVEEKFFQYETTTAGLQEVNYAMLPLHKTEHNLNQLDTSISSLSLENFENNYSQNTEVARSSYQQEEVFQTAKNESNPPDVSNVLYNTCTMREPLKENTVRKEIATYEKAITVPQLFFTKGLFEFKNYLPFVDVTTAKKPNYHFSNFSSTADSFYMNNLWGLRKVEFQPHTITTHTSPFSSKFESFNDKIVDGNRQKFNEYNGLKSTVPTLQSSNEANKTDWNDWAPLNIPDLENEFDSMRTSSENTNEVQEIDIPNLQYLSNSNKHINKFNNKSKQYLFDMGMRRNLFNNNPYSVNFSKESTKISSRIVNHPIKNTASRYNEKNYSNEGRLIDIKPEKMVFIKKQKKGSVDSFTESLGKFERYKDLFHENSVMPMFLKQFHQINFLPFSRKNIDKTLYDSANFMGKLYFKHSNEATLKNDRLIEYNGNKGIDEISKQVMATDKVRNNINWENAPNTSIDVPYKETNKNSGIKDESNSSMSTSVSFLNLKSNSFRDVDDSIPFLHFTHQISSEKPSLESQDDQFVTRLNKINIHNYQNEKLLANETGFGNGDKIPLTTTFNQEFYQKDSGKVSKNIIFPKFLYNSAPGVIDHNKNEISAVEMSLVKIIHKNPKLLQSQFNIMPFKTNYINNDGSIVTRDKMLSQLLLKMNNFVNKLVTDKYIKKRSVAEAPLNSNNNIDKYSHDIIERSPTLLDDDKQVNHVNDKIKHYQFSNEWKNNMQSLIDKQNEKMNIHNDIYDEVVQTDPSKLISFAINNNLQHLGIRHKPLEKFLENKIVRNKRNLNSIRKNNEKQPFFTDKKRKRNILGNTKMKSRELEFILERNLPSLPLNKRQFISYMMTGMKKSGCPLTYEDEMHSYLSKKNLQSLIDRNSKKVKVVIEPSNKRPRKKEWQNK